MTRSLRFLLLVGLLLTQPAAAWETQGPYPFGVLNQRSVTLTAEYWNPILTYVHKKTGVPLTLRIARSAKETTDMATQGELAFVYSNHLFTPERAKLGFKVLARQDGESIRGQIVVTPDSAARNLEDLAGKSVAFANPYGFAGYFVPYDALLKAGVTVEPVFASTQEAGIGQLKHGRVAAAGVNSQIMADFARREGFAYRTLFSSEPYFDLAVMAHPRVPESAANAVQKALIEMQNDPDGRNILATSAQLLKLLKPRGFVFASDRDYDNYRAFFRRTRVPLDGQ